MGNSINNIKFLGRKFFGVRNLNTSPVYDVDAQNYFNANTAITSAADKNAINTFYLGLKTDGIYTKLKAMYLPIWGSAATCKWNLINPLDTNAAFRLTFSTGWTFSSSGITPLNAFSDTFLIPNNNLTTNSNHFSVYVRTNQTSNAVALGSFTDGNRLNQLNISTGTGLVYYTGPLTTEVLSSLTDSKGFFIGTTRANNDRKTFRNGVQQQSLTTIVGTNYSIFKMFLGARNNSGSPGNYTTQQISFSTIGNGLTDLECINLSSRINTLMTYFGINVY
jgi:hypothetical protein